MENVQNMDIDRDIGITRTLRETLPEWVVPVFEVVTYFGDLWVVLAVLGAVWIADIWRGITRDARSVLWTDRTAYFIGSVLGGLALIVILKTVFGLPRPPATLQVTPRAGFGFPSGHTMAATILWGAFAIWGRLGSQRARFVVASVLIGLVALSRLVLGVHYAVDVIASVGFGAFYLLIARKSTVYDPKLMFSGVVVLGVIAFVTSGASRDGQLAFIGTAGAALAWWILTRPDVQTWVHDWRQIIA
jgi:membrane-associated phospholipid phosphatase